MDAFYAAIEQRDHPELRGQPVIVGSPPSRRGVVCAASYEARKFGVRSAMPSATAGRLCPKGIFIPPRMAHYREESQKIMAIVAQTGALIEQVSIDEAYLDVSAIVGQASSRSRFSGNPNAREVDSKSEMRSDAETCKTAVLSSDAALLRAMPVAKELKRSIFGALELTASVGIASNKLLAKLVAKDDRVSRCVRKLVFHRHSSPDSSAGNPRLSVRLGVRRELGGSRLLPAVHGYPPTATSTAVGMDHQRFSTPLDRRAGPHV